MQLKAIVAALITGITSITTSRKQVESLKSEVASRDTIIAELTAKLQAEDADDAAREAALADALKAKEEADARFTALTAEIEEANAKAAELIAATSENPDIPVTVDAEGVATETPVTEEAPPAE